MTASKPPDKTLVGMPSDLKTVLQKLDQAAADQATLNEQAAAAAPLDMGKTRMGQGASERPRSVPPPLPSQRTAAGAPPRAANLPNTTMAPNVPNPNAANAAAPMDRTLIGMPSDMQAALQRALAEVVASPAQAAPARPPAHAPAPQRPPPAAAGPGLWTQPVRAVGVSSTPPSEAQVRATAARGPAHAGHSAPPAAAPAYAQAAAQGYPVPPAQAPGLDQGSDPGYGSGLGYQAGQGYRPDQGPPGATAMKVQAPLDWPPATRGRTDSGLVPRAEGSGASPRTTLAAGNVPPPLAARPGDDHVAQRPNAGDPAAYSSAQPELSSQPATAVPGHPEPSPGMHPTRLTQLEAGAEAPNAGAATAHAPRLALPLTHDEARKTKKSAGNPPKRWPAISLILLAVVAFGGVIVLRAPQLLPEPLSGLLAPTPAVPDELIAPEAALPELPAAGLTTDTAAATDATGNGNGKAAFTPTPARPPAAPAMTSGASAQLEKKAIERLIANDYAAAKPLYEKLRSAEPSRGEFGVMVELLNRANAGLRP